MLAQLLKNWSVIFFEMVTLFNLGPSTSPNWGGIPRWAPVPPIPHQPRGSPGSGADLVGPLFGSCGLLDRSTFQKIVFFWRFIVFLKENVRF